ncbi:hypothetical protein [Microbacterium radiodurans]|uniref:Uncharacterized protein n=1 Tax=Microbacterium radiodurans TaxID=661398 RepID=A0A5J5IZ04_9MICO|nr:hypothetical protein [Microbacterium radiodurans]KAA9089750.1 hypothetical protein F6B42_04630 [Microbacterium radiodurans]
MNLAALTRSWPSLAAWGAGLVQLGLGGGMVTRGVDVASRGVGLVLATVGATALVWGIIALARGRLVAPGVAMAIALLGTLSAGVALFVDPVRVSVHAVAVAVALWLALGVASAVLLRRRSRRSSADDAQARPSGPAPAAGVAGIIVGALAVAILVTPALSAAEAGSYVDDSGNPIVVPGHGH